MNELLCCRQDRWTIYIYVYKVVVVVVGFLFILFILSLVQVTVEEKTQPTNKTWRNVKKKKDKPLSKLQQKTTENEQKMKELEIRNKSTKNFWRQEWIEFDCREGKKVINYKQYKFSLKEHEDRMIVQGMRDVFRNDERHQTISSH